MCGSDEVQYATWYSPNSGEVGEAFGTWNYGDNTFCCDCDTQGRDPNASLVTSGEPGYEEAVKKWRSQKKKRSASTS